MLTPLQLQIARKRILICLERIFVKLQISVSLSFILENNGEKLLNIFEQNEVEKIMNSCWKYMEEHATDNSPTTSGYFDSLHDSKRKYYMNDSRIDTNFTEALFILLANPDIEKMAVDYCETCSSERRIFLNAINDLRDIVVERIHVTAEEEREHDAFIYNTWKQNKYYMRKIEEVTAVFKAEEDTINEKLSAKRDHIDALSAKMDEMNALSDLAIKGYMNKSELMMSTEADHSNEELQDLQRQEEAITRQYEKLLEQHLVQEKALRVKRFKVEAQLTGMLSKYDTDIGDFQAELESLTELHDSEKEVLDALQLEVDEQEHLYYTLMREKYEEEKAIFEAKLKLFMQTRAVIFLQRKWREVLLRKQMKKKKKRKKGKK